MPFAFEQTRRTATDLFGRVWFDFRWNDVRVPLKQPRPQHRRRGLTFFKITGGTETVMHHGPCFIREYRQPPEWCPEYLRFRKRLSFPEAR